MRNSQTMRTVAALFCLTITSCIAQFQTVPRGKKYSEVPSSEYKLYFEDRQGSIVSPWHDVPLYTQSDKTNQTYNMIVEIPRFSQAKFEIHREHMMNPIVQDKEDNHLRYIPNVFPWHGHVCNYGAFPQTWENPFHEDEWTGLKGDKDPIDVCEVGTNPVPTGTVLPVKIFGILAMLDGGETDWKVIVMNSKEAAEKGIETLEDLRSEYPGVVEAVQRFFTVYKVPAGKPENVFAYNGEVKDKNLAVEVISFTNMAWKEMIHNCSISGENVGTFNSANALQGTACSVDKNTARGEVNKQPPLDPIEAALPRIVDDWSFLPASSSRMGTLIVQPFFALVLMLFVFKDHL